MHYAVKISGAHVRGFEPMTYGSESECATPQRLTTMEIVSVNYDYTVYREKPCQVTSVYNWFTSWEGIHID